MGEGKVRANPKKIEAIMQAPAPKDHKQLKAYLGLINYFGKFVPNISSRLVPLYALLKDEWRFRWSDECERVFQESKRSYL